MADKTPSQIHEEQQEVRLAALEQQLAELTRAYDRQQRIHIQEQANLLDGLAQACQAQATTLRNRLPMEVILRKVPEEEAANRSTAVLIRTGGVVTAYGKRGKDQETVPIDLSELDAEVIEEFFGAHVDGDAEGAAVTCNIYKKPILI